MSKSNTTETVKRGRPVVEGSKRQAVLAMREAKRAQGLEIKRGRPAGTKKTIDVEVVAKTKTTKSKAPKQDASIEFSDVVKSMVAPELN